MSVEIRTLSALPPGFVRLQAAARREGVAFVDRLGSEWASGANRFDRPGERFVGAFDADSLVGFGGVNRDPYLDEDGLGRLRHVYVEPAMRGRGVGAAIVHTLVRLAAPAFSRLRLRTQDAQAFYEHLAFRPIDEPAATHALVLPEVHDARERGRTERR